MSAVQLLEYLFIAIAGSAVAVAVLFVSAAWFERKRVTARQLLLEIGDRPAFLFDGEDLIDATEAGQDLIGHRGGPGSDWDRVLHLLRPSFPDLTQQLAKLPEAQKMQIPALGLGDQQIVDAEHWDGLVRLTLVEDGTDMSRISDAVTVAALEDEVETLRTLAEDSPQLIWRLDNKGEITWANRAYLDLSMAVDGQNTDDLPSWPPRHVFEQINAAPMHGEATRRRVPVAKDGDEDVDWYEVTSMRRGNGSVHFAADANGVVRAERAQREFVQTLTKTFADLSTGLTIFDRHRRLVLFNPAFLDMSELPIEFLSTRPVIQSVLDRLREAHILPEPRDYASWRDQIAELESAAQDGTYSENWTLPTGQTYRVTGRPHPDGAIAFLFEDISSEVSLARRFRSELEFGQSVIDNIEEAVVVFSSSGGQVATNRRYDELWNITDQTDETLAEAKLMDAMTIWREQTTPTPTWSDLRDFVGDYRERAEWSETVHLKDGRPMACRVVPLPGGATMVAFRVQEVPSAIPGKISSGTSPNEDMSAIGPHKIGLARAGG